MQNSFFDNKNFDELQTVFKDTGIKINNKGIKYVKKFYEKFSVCIKNLEHFYFHKILSFDSRFTVKILYIFEVIEITPAVFF